MAEKKLEITVFAKNRNTKDGKKFTTYFATMPGREKPTKVKFRQVCGAPECPANIILHKGDCNMSKESYTDDVTGEVKYSDVLWVSAFENGAPYEDKSMDEWF